MQPKSIIVRNDENAQTRLADLFPEEIEFFKRRFIWSSNSDGCYTRHRYEPLYVPVFGEVPKWCPLKTRGGWQRLYTELVDSLVEKHLDLERFHRTASFKDRLFPPTDETAFWVGTMAGKRTFNDCLDLDSHDTIAWRLEPTRWHPDKTGVCGGPYDHRYLPVVRPSLKFFQMAKIVHDNFPNRIWAFSSANFGLGVWSVSDDSELTHVLFDRISNRLEAVGLPNLEHYPRPPKTIGSLGKTHRRPCGMDSAIITEDGILTDPIVQIRAFISPPRTPSFPTIVQTCISMLRQSYDSFIQSGGTMDHKPMPVDERICLVKGCEQIIDDVLTWLDDGCHIDSGLLQHVEPESEPKASVTVENNVITMLGESVFSAEEDDSVINHGDYPDSFWQADLKAVAGSGQWVQFVKFLVDHGFPVDDKFEKVISPLALWFGFVELFGKDRSRIKDVLHRFVLTRHNGKVTRLLAGKDSEVLSNVDRIVDSVLDGEDDHGKELFALLRQKRNSGQYKDVFQFESTIMETAGPSLSSTQEREENKFYLICRGLIQSNSTPDWEYEPDLTPLPDDLQNEIRDAFKQSKRQLRRNKTGRYPTLDAITQFFNYLFSGRKIGTRRASQKLLIQMGFPSKNKKRDQIINVLTTAGLLHKGSYRSKSRSRRWMLDKSVVSLMNKEQKEQAAAS
jgi:hypothetical protein